MSKRKIVFKGLNKTKDALQHIYKVPDTKTYWESLPTYVREQAEKNEYVYYFEFEKPLKANIIAFPFLYSGFTPSCVFMCTGIDRLHKSERERVKDFCWSNPYDPSEELEDCPDDYEGVEI